MAESFVNETPWMVGDRACLANRLRDDFVTVLETGMEGKMVTLRCRCDWDGFERTFYAGEVRRPAGGGKSHEWLERCAQGHLVCAVTHNGPCQKSWMRGAK